MKMVRISLVVLIAALALAPACKKKPPVAKPTTPPTSSFPGSAPAPTSGGGSSTNINRPPPPPTDPTANTMPRDPSVSTSFAGKTPDEINKMEVLKPVFFLYDSDTLDDAAKKQLDENAQLLKQNTGWVITVEGHCDERGTAEYNLALGDRRALAAKNYLLSLGISADRIRTVSYGKEFPFDSGHEETAWSHNRRAHFTVTEAK